MTEDELEQKKDAARRDLGKKVVMVLDEYGHNELDLGGAFMAYLNDEEYRPTRPCYRDPETSLRIEQEVTDFIAPPKVYADDELVFEGEYHADPFTGTGIHTYRPGDWEDRIEELYDAIDREPGYDPEQGTV